MNMIRCGEGNPHKKLRIALERAAQHKRCKEIISKADISKHHKKRALLHCVKKHFGRYYDPEVCIAHTSD